MVKIVVVGVANTGRKKNGGKLTTTTSNSKITQSRAPSSTTTRHTHTRICTGVRKKKEKSII